MLAKLTYTLLYHLVHWAIHLTCAFERVAANLWRRLRWLWTDANSQVDVTLKAKRLRCVPKHIGILLAEETISFADLSNLIAWCVTLGISFISLYDHDGVLKKKKYILQEHLQKMKSQFLGKSTLLSSKFEINFDAISISEIPNNESENPPKIRINIFSHIDGQHRLGKVAADICHSVKSGAMKSSDVELDTVSNYVTENLNCPDPDLVLQFGDVYSILGFLPWNLRLTELLLLSSHHNIEYNDFYKMLLRYSACEQRCGT